MINTTTKIRQVYELHITYINRDNNTKIREETIDLKDSNIIEVKDILKYYREELGACKGKVFIDVEDKSIHIGYHFVKKMKYEDVDEYYYREAWVTLNKYKETIVSIREYEEEK